LETERETEVIRRLGSEYDQEAKKMLIEHNLRLVVYIAKKFDNTGVGVEDLISIGTIGLIKAINTFNPDKNIKLATYASRCIENEILMYLRRNSKTRLEVSIDEPLNVDWDGNELLLSDILGTDEDVIYRDIETDVERTLLMTAIAGLTGRERMIIELRFGLNTAGGEEKTQKEVADMLGISQSYISRLEKKIMGRLKKEIVRFE
jgi:RNA polymerase sporulation-specific sigma factor